MNIKQISAFCTIAFLLALLLITPRVGTPQMLAQSSEDGILSMHAAKAHKNGKSSIEIVPPIELWAEPETLDLALAHNTVVIAQLVASDVTHDRNLIITYHKYKLIEQLSTQASPIDNQALPKEIPPSLLPLEPGEFLVPEVGGTAIIDGITIKEHSDRDGTLPEQQRHLMFLVLKCSGALGLPNYGPGSFFWLDDLDNIQVPNQSGAHRVRTEVLTRTGGKLSVMRTLASQVKSAGVKK